MNTGAHTSAKLKPQSCLVRRRSRTSVAGFTLIELMVVVAVVAILAAIALPSYQEQVRKSRRGQAKADLVELAQRAERHHTTNNTYATFWATVPAADQQSPRGAGDAHYSITIADAGASSYLLTATPLGAQAVDRCGALAISAAGVRTHSQGSDDECQFGSLP